MDSTLTTFGHTTKVLTKAASHCTHRRVVDDVRTATGHKTGRLICKECQAEFPDPTYQDPRT